MLVAMTAVAGLLLAAPPPAARKGEGIVARPSRYSVADSLDRVEALAKAKGLTVFARIDHAREAARVGLEMRPTRLLVLGSPKAGTPLMKASPTIAIDLPLKVLAWQDREGKVWVGTNSPAYLARRHGLDGELAKSLGGIVALVDKALE